MAKTNKKSDIVTKLKELFALTQMKFIDIELEDGSILRTPDAALAAGSTVTLVGADGTEMEAEDGEYTVKETGNKIEIKGGVVESLGDAPAEDAKPEDVAQEDDKKGKKPAPAAPAPAGKKDEEKMDDAAPAPAADGSVEMITEILQNISDRLANVEKALSAGSASTQAMKAEFEAFKKSPGAKPITKTAGKTADGKEPVRYSTEWFAKERETVIPKAMNRNKNNQMEKLEAILEARKAGKTMAQFATEAKATKEKFAEASKTEKTENKTIEPRTGGSAELAGDWGGTGSMQFMSNEKI